ncbi:1-aminocyclopropane-1-carboxylate deaminase [Fluviispira multicolorata]|uniref:1-aminocyclopropane-1-carboxylate deaminase n=1 Tax=Fluviispira multicolorata TaxID=2654512 RepID=A0A833JCU3_9BACT|nr:1-aminocyclopropane-1-carboxylate deaminase [Fluviispira multicolorata]KAB8027402.1 1-aminocyclopropane-1-carboxylate deaminase [Fluviispira multicolorata]
MENHNKIEQYLKKFILMDYSKNSRVHSLKTYQYSNAEVFVKRDDELGFGVSGSKIRKYISLIPTLKKEQYKEVIILGGPYSNNILSAVQLLIENGIKPILFFDRRNKKTPLGNFLLTSLFLDESSIQWLEKDDFNKKNEIINLYKEKQLKKGVRVGFINEGALMYEAFPGACTLALDILRNEQEKSCYFDHIIIDSGTGLTAISLILCYSLLQLKTKIHILLIAGTEKEFNNSLNLLKNNFEADIIQKIKLQDTYKLYSPQSAKSFGSVNKKIMNNIAFIAKNEGILTDPIYSSKLFLEARNIINEKNLSGKILLIHSGGSLTLFGFTEKLQELI